MIRLLAFLFLCCGWVIAAPLPPQFPRVQGEFQMTGDWRVTLPGAFAKRFEKGEFGTDLVLWRPGMTCWTTVWAQKEGETPATTFEWRKAQFPSDDAEVFEFRDTMPLRYAFLLREKPEGEPERWAFHAFTFGESGHLLMVIYFDKESDLEVAKQIWLSIAETSSK